MHLSMVRAKFLQMPLIMSRISVDCAIRPRRALRAESKTDSLLQRTEGESRSATFFDSYGEITVKVSNYPEVRICPTLRDRTQN